MNLSDVCQRKVCSDDVSHSIHQDIDACDSINGPVDFAHACCGADLVDASMFLQSFETYERRDMVVSACDGVLQSESTEQIQNESDIGKLHNIFHIFNVQAVLTILLRTRSLRACFCKASRYMKDVTWLHQLTMILF